MRSLPAGLAVELAKRGRSLQRIHLVDVQTSDGQNFFWSDVEGKFLSALTAAEEQYKPWIKTPPTIKFFRSLQADAGEFTVQNLSGNLIDREVAALIKVREFEGAYCIYRPWFMPLDAAGFEFHGFVSQQNIGPEDVTFRVLQLFQPNEVSAYEYEQTQECHFRFGSAQCGYRRGTLFVPLTMATIYSSSTIGASSLNMVPDLFKGEAVMILAGTGAGQERYVSSHTATTLTVSSNWTTVPDSMSQFIVTGPGTMKVSPQLADIYSSNTIGKTGLGRTINEDQGELVAILAGTGAGQQRRIVSNTADLYTVSPAWTVTPDGTSRFIVVYRTCPRNRASCLTRGVIERFSGIIHLNAQVTRKNPSRQLPYVLLNPMVPRL